MVDGQEPGQLKVGGVEAPARLVIASRQSRLAMWQAEHVQARLRELYPRCEVEILGMTTEGDRVLDRALNEIGGKGLFIKELEVALLEQRADLAVHSLKDVPMEVSGPFALAAIMAREDPRDAFVSAKYASLESLPEGARVGTSSLRRAAQIRRAFPKLEVLPLRGNVNTRLARLDEGRYDAIVLAAAGLKRLGLAERIRAIVPPSLCLPAAGQGALGTAVGVPYRLARRYGERKWLEEFLSVDGKEALNELAEGMGEHEATVAALRRRLDGLKRLPFLVPHARENAIDNILSYLERGMHVVLDFGRHGDNTAAYILVANLLTRRIHAMYRERTERALAEGGARPRPLVITIEEAHKFLNHELSGQTIFGIIAREMRKYNVTLLIIDQRPSGIDEEVMSQLGTKITCLLDNDKDIESVLTGVSGKGELKAVLSKLDSRQQALIFGHAVPMPVVVKTREYGTPESYKELGFREALERKKESDKDLKDLFGE